MKRSTDSKRANRVRRESWPRVRRMIIRSQVAWAHAILAEHAAAKDMGYRR